MKTLARVSLLLFPLLLLACNGGSGGGEPHRVIVLGSTG